MSTLPTAESIRAEAERRGAPGAGPRCRSCGSPIFFGLTTKGRRMPIDPAPVEDGNVVLVSLEARMETGVRHRGVGDTGRHDGSRAGARAMGMEQR